MLYLAVKGLNFSRQIRFLRDVELPEASSIKWPKVSLVVPACNEALTILSATQSLLQMDYPNLELLLVDDRSTDGTFEIIQRLAQDDPRVKFVRVNTLPAGWLGKVHALHQGVLASTGEWLLFSDADVHFQMHSLKKAIVDSQRNNLGFLAVTPSIVKGTLLLRIIVAQFVHWASISIDLKRIKDAHYRDSIGTGAFNLIRKSAYDRSRGLEWLKMEVVDDAGIAFELKASKAKVGVLSGLGEIEIEWYPTLIEFIRGLEKNGFAIFQYSLAFLTTVYLGVVAIFVGMMIAPFMAQSANTMCFTWLCLSLYLAASALSLRSMMTISPFVVVLFPFTFVLMPLVFVRSAVLCLWNQGVHWRGTFYPLAELRRNQRLKILNLMFNRKLIR